MTATETPLGGAQLLDQSARDHLLLHFARNGDAHRGSDPLLVLERGEGPYVYDTGGNEYIDALSSLFCAQLGYSYGVEMAEAASAQLQRLAFNTNWGTAHPPAIELAERIAAVAPGDLDHVFFTSGGSEAVEAAWKIARTFFIATGQPQRRKAIARHIAYHGVTLGALSFTGVPAMKEPFAPPPIEVTHVSNTNRFRSEYADDPARQTAVLLSEMEQAIEAAGPDQVALIIAEPVQNAGGCITAPPRYWEGLRSLADRHGILLMADEVITGFGRIGEWFASERFGVVPDIISCAKGLTSAYAPMGAAIVRSHVAEALSRPKQLLSHGITFGGHPLAAAIALKNLEIFERDAVLENVRALEPRLEDRLQALGALPIVGDVRGAGFFWAVELVRDERAGRFDAAQREALLRGFLPGRLRASGLIARADDRGDSVLQIAPPLICDGAVLDEIVTRLGTILTEAGDWVREQGWAQDDNSHVIRGEE